MRFADVSRVLKETYAPAVLGNLTRAAHPWWTTQTITRLPAPNPARRAFLKAVCTTGGRVHRSTPQITHILRRAVLRELQNSTSSAFVGTVTWEILTRVQNPAYSGRIDGIGT